MCIGIPMRIVAVDGHGRTWCAQDDESPSEVDIGLIGPQPKGTWLLVFLSSARQVLTEEEALAVARALDGVAAALAGEEFGHYFSDLTEREPQLPPHLRPGEPRDQ